MDVYWSIERCGWAPCRGPQQPLATQWGVPVVEDEPVPDLPRQRLTQPAPAEA